MASLGKTTARDVTMVWGEQKQLLSVPTLGWTSGVPILEGVH